MEEIGISYVLPSCLCNMLPIGQCNVVHFCCSMVLQINNLTEVIKNSLCLLLGLNILVSRSKVFPMTHILSLKISVSIWAYLFESRTFFLVEDFEVRSIDFIISTSCLIH